MSGRFTIVFESAGDEHRLRTFVARRVLASARAGIVPGGIADVRTGDAPLYAV